MPPNRPDRRGFAAARRVPEADCFVRKGQWTFERRWDPDLLLGRDVHGALLGVIGLGAIGRSVASRARGFGMQVLARTRSGRVAAALDVFADEPLDPGSPLRQAPSLVLAPHIGSASVATRRRMAALAVENLLAGLRGDPMPHQAR